jgi:hypothetical protein
LHGGLLEVEWLLFICLRGQKNGICALLLFRLSHLSGKLNLELSSAKIRIMGKSLMPHGEFVIAYIFLSEAAQDQAT